MLRSAKGVILNQRKYSLELLSEMGLSGAKPAPTPLESNKKLTTVEFDIHVGDTTDPALSDSVGYQKLIGKLIYLTITRPDLCFAVQVLSQFMQRPKQSHMEAAMRVSRYVKGSPGLGLFYPVASQPTLVVYCDSDWAACPNTRRSVTGYAIKLGDSLISWKSKKKHTVSRSSAEAEYRSMSAAIAETIWITGLLTEMGFQVTKLVPLYYDNKAAIQIASNPIFHERTKHIEIDCHFIREKIKDGLIKPEFVPTGSQLADVFTKALGVAQHRLLFSQLGVLNAFHIPA